MNIIGKHNDFNHSTFLFKGPGILHISKMNIGDCIKRYTVYASKTPQTPCSREKKKEKKQIKRISKRNRP
jgi:hypothetical protein